MGYLTLSLLTLMGVAFIALAWPFWRYFQVFLQNVVGPMSVDQLFDRRVRLVIVGAMTSVGGVVLLIFYARSMT